MASCTAALMLKAPVEGTVKTRLAQDLGAPAATSAYRRLVEHQLRQIPDDWPVSVYHSPADAGTKMRNWLGGRPSYFPQVDGSLGDRLNAAMTHHFAHSEQHLVLLGGDCPYLTQDRLENAAKLLTTTDAVIVPAADGGYCLLGLRAPHPCVFEDIDWSTARVANQTRARLRTTGTQWLELPDLEDVDDLDSWQRATTAFPELGF